MIKLVRGTLGQELKFRPERTRISLSERGSTCAPQIGPDGPEISAGDWLQSEDGPAQGTVWIVNKIETQIDTRTTTIQTEHAISLLRRRILPGEVKPEDMGGSATGCTARQAAAYILGRQSDWVLGDCDFSDSHPYSFDGEDLFSALETVSDSLDGCLWEYDFSVYPFRLHLRRGSDSIDSEIRMSRNAHTIRRTIDTQDTCTRFYPVGKENLRLPGAGYVSRNEGLYGVFEKTDTDESMDSAAKLTDWANGYLRRHAQPLVTIVVDGLELARDTGESLDRFRVGRMCRIPLAEYGEAAVTERINKIDYPDAEGEADKCTITIGGEIDDIAKIVSRMQKKSGGGGRASARNAEEDHAWIEDTTEHVYLVAEALVGKDPSGNPVDWSRVSVLGVDGTGIHGRVTVAEGELVKQETRIDATETAITAEVTDRTNADSTLNGKISVEAGKISQIVSAVGADGAVTAASIVLAINQSTGESEAKLDAQHVYIGNQKSTTVINGKLNASDVTSDYLAGKIADIANLQVQNLTAGWLGIKSGSGSLGTIDARTLIRAVQIDGPTNNSYKLQYMRVSNSEWQDAGTFSRSISSASWSWAGGAPRVTLSPQDQTFYGPAINGIIFTGDKTWATDKKSFTQDFYCYDENSNNVYRENLSIDTKDSYNAGYSKGSPSSGTAGGRTSGVSSLVHDFTIKRADGTTKTIAIDVSNIYTTARKGYTQGTFTSLTAMPVVSSGGALYYTAGTASFYYQGNGTSGYLRGNKVGCYAAGTTRTVYKRNTSSSKQRRLQHYGMGKMTGQVQERDWYYVVSSGGTRYYESGGDEEITVQGSYQELYAGDGSYVTDRGSQVSVLPVSSTSVRLGSSGTYYKKS